MVNDLIQQWGDSGYAAFTSFAVSVLSLFIAICAWISGSKANRRLIAIEVGRDRRAEQSSAKARLMASITNPAKHTYFLVITNEGSGQAREINVLVDGKELHSHPAVEKQAIKTSLGPGAQVKYLLAPSLSTRNPSHVRIAWNDDSGDNGLYESNL